MMWTGVLFLSGVLVTCLGQQRSNPAAGVDVREGQSAVLRCRYDPSLAPPNQATFYWSQRSVTEWDNVAIQESALRKRYRVDYNGDEGRYDLHIRNASYQSDNGEFACKIRRVGSGSDIHSERVRLTVLLAPGPPSIELPAQPLSEGEPGWLSCSSSGGSPAPEIRWYRQGSSTPLPADLSRGQLRSEPTVSRLRLLADRQDNRAQIQCVVWNRAMPEGQRLTATATLDVNYKPRITMGPENPLRVEEGSAVRMQCEVDAKPPVANVRWVRNGAFINTNRVHRIDAVRRSDAGRYTCSAQNVVGEGQAELRLEVLYGPRVSVGPAERQLAAGASVQVQCQVEANPPAHTIHWVRPGRPDFQQSGDTLRLSQLTAADSGQYVCVATNRLLGQQRTANATVSVLVRHRPGRGRVVPERPVGVEGRPLVLTCVSDPPGHPPPKYRWWRADRPDVAVSLGQNFSVASVQRRHAGQYLCQPENDLGRGQPGSVQLPVYQRPRLTGRLQAAVIRPLSTADFSVSCSGQGRPRPSVTWLKDGDTVQTADGRYDVKIDESQLNDDSFSVRSTLNFRGRSRENNQLSPADRGNYTCRFENEAGEAESTMLLRIRHSPIVYHRYGRVAFDVGETALIQCQMQSYPPPVFRWSHNGLLVEDAGRYRSNTSQLGNDVHMSSLRVSPVRPADYGEFVCQAENEEGEHSTVLRLQAKGRPEAPSRVTAVQTGTSWVLLDWRPGFSGGHPHTMYHVILLDERDRDRAFDCQTERPCNVTSLQHSTTYRLRVRATNAGGDSEYSDQIQFSTLLDVSELPEPQRVQYEPESGQINFHVISTPAEVVATLDVRSGDGDWRRTDQVVKITNNRGLAVVEQTEGDVSDVRVRLCLRQDTNACGTPVLAERVAAGSLASASGSAVPTIIIVAVVAIGGVAALVLLFICCCRRSRAGQKAQKTVDQPDYGRSKLPPYYVTTGGGIENKSVSDAVDLSRLAVPDTNKPVYGGGGYQQQSAGGGYMDNSYSASNHGGSVNSQDSLWQVKSEVQPQPSYLAHSHGQPAPASYLPDQQPAPAANGAGYGDYAYYPPYQYGQQDGYGRPYEPEQYGATTYPGNGYTNGGSSYRDVSGLPNPYGERDPEARPHLSFDESLESGLSTPNSRNRRVIREIVV